MTGKRLAVLGAAVLAGGAAAVVPAVAAGTDHPVTVADFSFTPATVTVAVGDTVTWSYPSGSSAHNVAFSDGPAYRMPATPQTTGWTVQRTFDTAGTFHYRCDLHGFMQGTVVVGDGTTTTQTTPPTQTTTTTPPPTTPATVPDTTPPRARNVTVARRRLRLTLSEPARLTGRITRRGRRVARLRARLAAGRVGVALPRPRRGRYRITFTLTDAEGNRSASRSVALRIR